MPLTALALDLSGMKEGGIRPTAPELGGRAEEPASWTGARRCLSDSQAFQPLSVPHMLNRKQQQQQWQRCGRAMHALLGEAGRVLPSCQLSICPSGRHLPRLRADLARCEVRSGAQCTMVNAGPRVLLTHETLNSTAWSLLVSTDRNCQASPQNRQPASRQPGACRRSARLW